MCIAKSFYYPAGLLLSWLPLKENAHGITLSDFNNLFESLHHRTFIQIYFEQLQDPSTLSHTLITHLSLPPLPYQNPAHSPLTTPAAKNLNSNSNPPPGQISQLLSQNRTNHYGGISLGTYLELRAELDASDRELAKLRKELSAGINSISEKNANHDTSPTSIETFEATSMGQATVLYTIIGSILSVTLGKSKSGHLQSIYANQAAIVDAITTQFPDVPGLSKRTLDRKFAEARRRFAQVNQA